MPKSAKGGFKKKLKQLRNQHGFTKIDILPKLAMNEFITVESVGPRK